MFDASSRGRGFGSIVSGAGGPVAERGVWALCVVMGAPFLDDHLRLPETVEDFSIQTFIPEFAIEGFAEPILPR